MLRYIVRYGLLVLAALLIVPSAPDSAEAGRRRSAGAQAIARLRKALNQDRRELRPETNQIVSSFRQELQATREDQIFTGADKFDGTGFAMDQALGQSYGVFLVAALAFGVLASQNLDGLDGEYPRGFYWGDCGELDKARQRMIALLQQLQRRLEALLKQNARKIEKKDKFKMACIATPTAPEFTAGNAPNGGPDVTPDPPKGLSIDGLAGGSSIEVNDDGKLFAMGVADPALGDVTVTIRGPNGTEVSRTVSPRNDCRFFVSIPGTGQQGNLPEGNYTVEVTQGAGSAAGAIGVPGIAQ